jgi:hypothetical protein
MGVKVCHRLNEGTSRLRTRNRVLLHHGGTEHTEKTRCEDLLASGLQRAVFTVNRNQSKLTAKNTKLLEEL